jgi:hypothetical protein
VVVDADVGAAAIVSVRGGLRDGLIGAGVGGDGGVDVMGFGANWWSRVVGRSFCLCVFEPGQVNYRGRSGLELPADPAVLPGDDVTH